MDTTSAPYASPSTDAPMLRLSVGRILGTSFRIFLRNFVPFVLLSLLLHVPTLLLQLGDPEETGAARFAFLLDLILSNVAAGAMTYGVFMQLRGQRVGIGASLATGLARLLPVLGVGLIVGVAVFLGSLAAGIPGTILGCMFFVAVPAAVVERPGVFGALKRSKDLTDGFKWTIFGVTFLLGLLMIAAMLGGGLALGAFTGDGSPATVAVVLWLAGAVVGGWQSVAAAVTYHDLRLLKEGVGIEELAKIFD